MSANRSVQAAQRRRSGPPEPQAPGRGGPQPSINSAQMFASQVRTGPGPNLPPGRISAQQMNMQQEAMYNNVGQGGSNSGIGIGNINKMTIPQAITLVTLRLGALETKMMNLEMELPQMLGGVNTNNMEFYENGVIQSLMERVDNIEKGIENGSTATTSINTNPAELTAIKNQLETVKQSIIQFKGISATLVNDNKALKTQIEKLKQELVETKQLLNTLQTASFETSQKLLELELSVVSVSNNGMMFDDLTVEGGEVDGDIEEDVDDENIQATFSLSNTNEILGLNLKEVIELELNG
jgi:hypothetical protein